MSAFVCNDEHIEALAAFAAHRRGGSMNVDPRYLDLREDQQVAPVTDDIAHFYANVLYAENVRSVNHRYQNSFEPRPTIDINRSWAYYADKLSAVDLLKMCDCLEYQSCECADYRTTLAFDLLNRIRRAAIHRLAGYDDAPWDYSGPQAKAA